MEELRIMVEGKFCSKNGATNKAEPYILTIPLAL
jgi:hypothetical protein